MAEFYVRRVLRSSTQATYYTCTPKNSARENSRKVKISELEKDKIVNNLIGKRFVSYLFNYSARN